MDYNFERKEEIYATIFSRESHLNTTALLIAQNSEVPTPEFVGSFTVL